MTPEEAITWIADYYGNDSGVERALRVLSQSLQIGESFRVDAERYRWLRNSALLADPYDEEGNMVWCVVGLNGRDLHPEDGAELDSAVDAARKPA